MAFQIVKGWPFGSLELQLAPGTGGSTRVGDIAFIGAARDWALASYNEDGSDAGLQPAFLFDRQDLTRKQLGIISSAMIIVDATHYFPDTYAVGDKLTAILGKFAKPEGLQPAIASILAIDTASGKLTLLWYGPNLRQDVLPEPPAEDLYAAWDADQFYFVGNTVAHDDQIWVALVENIGSEPAALNADWVMLDSTTATMIPMADAWEGGEVEYQHGNLVAHAAALWIATVDNTDVEPDGIAPEWLTVVALAPYAHAWDAEVAYELGAIVSYDGQLWVSFAGEPLAGSEPATIDSTWILVIT